MVRVSFIGCLLVGTVGVLIAAAARAGPIFCQIVGIRESCWETLRVLDGNTIRLKEE